MNFIIIEDNVLYAYTDGSAKTKSGQGGVGNGGYGVVFVYAKGSGNERKEVEEDRIRSGHKCSTIGEMELKAAIFALEQTLRRKDLSRFTKVEVVSDSSYLVDDASRARYWKMNGWIKPDGKTAKNADLWNVLLNLETRIYRIHKLLVKYRKVKGHGKDPHNVQADRLALLSRQAPVNKPLHARHVRRKLFKGKVKLGCVPMKGQRLFLRVQGTAEIPKSKDYLVQYEVLNDDFTDAELRDEITTSDPRIKANHYYIVEVNEDSKNPRINEIIMEIDKNTGGPVEDKFN